MAVPVPMTMARYPRIPKILTQVLNKSSYFRVKLKRIKFKLYTEPDLDLT